MPKENNPAWFRLDLYDHLSELDGYGWIIELSTRIFYEERIKRNLSEKDMIWEEYLGDIRIRPGLTSKECSNISSIRTELANDKTAKEFDIRLNLSATDEKLADDFLDLLKELRKSFPNVISKRGKKSKINSKISSDNLNSWRAQGILPLYDLLIWKNNYDNELSHEAIGKLVFQNDFDDSSYLDKFNYSKKVLKKAKSYLEPLYFQQDIKSNK